MGFIGREPTSVPLTSSDITDGIITTDKIVDDAVTGAKIENTPSIANGLTLTDGNLVVASGHGIDFSATANSGGTMTSELLDDYEEGTWSVVIKSSGGTSLTTVNTGSYYVKIGTVVNCWFYIQRTDSTNPGGNLRLAGFPFTAKSTNYASMSGSVWIDNDDSGALDRRVFMYLGAASTEAQVIRTGTTSDATTLSEFGNNRYAYGFISYLTD